MIPEDDAHLSADAAGIFPDGGWLPVGVDVVKPENFGHGEPRVPTRSSIAALPNGRAPHPHLSRHLGGAAHIVSRRAAETALAAPAPFKVPLDHLLFNANVSDLARRFPPTIAPPAMAAQRAWGHDSDIAALDRADRPKGWAGLWRRARRGWLKVSHPPRQPWSPAPGARVGDVRFVE